MAMMLRRQYAPIGINPEDDPDAIPIGPDPSQIPARQTATLAPDAMGAKTPITASPVATTPKTPIGNPKLEADQAELSRLQKSGSGIDQLTHPVDAQGNPDATKHPGFLKKVGAVAARVGDIAGTALFPSVTAQIPGTQLHHDILVNQARGNVANDVETEQQQAQTRNLQMQPEIKQAQMDIKEQQQQLGKDKLTASLRQHGFKQDGEGNIIPLPYEEMSQDQQAVHDLKASQQEMADARTALLKAQKDGIPLQIQMAQKRLDTASQNAATASAKLGLQSKEFERDTFGTVNGTPIPGGPTQNGKPIGTKIATSNRKDVDNIDKTYVKPANDVEKSYQMMNQAYGEYKQAKAQGKDLPTGAQSMLALSTHLSTTFGNVKGARITKDMIEHHLGARGVSDGATVAVRRLVNGDVLSPGQWDAFHDLIKQSRDLSWKTAVKEATRKSVPVDFLPPDLQQQSPAKNSGGGATEEYVRDPASGKLVLKGGQ